MLAGLPTATLRSWSFWARPKQLAPEGAWLWWLILAGRGFGKTRTGAEWVMHRARHGPYFPIALVGQTKADVRDTMIEVGEGSILRNSLPDFRPAYQPSKRRVVWPNGVIGTVFSGDEPDQLRGPQHGSAWVDELAKMKYPTETMDNLEMGLRLGADPRGVITTTPRPIRVIKALLKDPDVHVTRGSSYENISNLSPRFIRRIIGKYEGTTLGRQELHAEVLDEVPGALWRRALVERYRVAEPPPLRRVVVGVDPGAGYGIVGAGVGEDGHGYVLKDLSGTGGTQWPRKAVLCYHLLEADRIVAEKNFGGDMVEMTLRAIDGRLPVTVVTASRGKLVRAEPVAALYEKGRVHHVGTLTALEDEMVTWTPEAAWSPHRMDALVWALTEVMLRGGGEVAGSVL